MSRTKPTPIPLCELTPGQQADFFALLAEKTRGTTREGKPYFLCRFRDCPARRRLRGLARRQLVRGVRTRLASPASSTSIAPSTANTKAMARS
jgi:hypothetical protein